MVRSVVPILKTSDASMARVRGFRLESDIRLPDFAEMAQEASALPVAGAIQGFFVESNVEVFQRSNQLAMGALVANVGIPVAAAFAEAASVLDTDVVAKARDFFAGLSGAADRIESEVEGGGVPKKGDVIFDAMAQGVGLAMERLAGNIPLAGLVVKAMIRTIQVAFRALRKQQQYGEAPEVVLPNVVYNPEFNYQMLNAVLRRIAPPENPAERYDSRDWTRLFGPPSLGRNRYTGEMFRLEKLENKNTILRRFQDSAYASEGWLGMVPGTSTLHQAVELENSRPREIGTTVLPSPQKTLTWLWKNSVGRKADVNPSMYCIEASRVRDTWQSYIFDLHTFIDESDLGESTKQRIIDLYNKGEGGRIFGWGSSIAPKPNEQDRYAPAKRSDVLEKRQWGYLDTVMVAYLDESFVALRKNTAMMDRWKQRKQELLDHPAVCEVDLKNVPDGYYREELRKKRSRCVAGNLWLTSKPLKPPGNTPEPGKGSALPDDSEGGPAEGETRGAHFLPWLALAGAGAYLAHKKGWLR